MCVWTWVHNFTVINKERIEEREREREKEFHFIIINNKSLSV